MITIAVSNQKGGVGKTTLTYNLARIISSKHNTTVLVIDNDPQGNLTSSLIENSVGSGTNTLNLFDGNPVEPIQVSKTLCLIGADITLSSVAERDFRVIFKLKEYIDSLNNRFDFVLIDCLPSFGHLHLAALISADYILIPVRASPYSLLGIKDLLSTIEKARKYFNPDLSVLGIIINQVDGRKPLIEKEMEKALRRQYKDLVFKAKINKRVRVEESPALRKSIIEYDPKGLASKEFKAVTSELLRRIRLSKKGGASSVK